jgi:hypothetical protein
MTTPANRRQQLLAIALAMQQAGHAGTTWTHEQLRIRAALNHRELIATRTPPAPAPEHQIGDFEAEP